MPRPEGDSPTGTFGIAPADDACSLSNKFSRAIGYRVVFLDNTWMKPGLVNRAFATTHDIVWPSIESSWISDDDKALVEE